MMRLAPGQQAPPLRIDSQEKWNRTGIEVRPGERYAFRAEGSWIDLTIYTTARGYETREAPALSRWFLSLFEGSLRMPGQNWFALVGTVGRSESTAFVIGERLDGWMPTAAGELWCFANDVPWAYFNNHGEVTLTVTRLA